MSDSYNTGSREGIQVKKSYVPDQPIELLEFLSVATTVDLEKGFKSRSLMCQIIQ